MQIYFLQVETICFKLKKINLHPGNQLCILGVYMKALVTDRSVFTDKLRFNIDLACIAEGD